MFNTTNQYHGKHKQITARGTADTNIRYIPKHYAYVLLSVDLCTLCPVHRNYHIHMMRCFRGDKTLYMEYGSIKYAIKSEYYISFHSNHILIHRKSPEYPNDHKVTLGYTFDF